VDQACLYAIVEPPTALDTEAVNGGEVKVATVVSGTLSHANGVIQGLSLQAANYEGVIVPVSNTNQLRFVSTTATTVAKVFAVVAA